MFKKKTALKEIRLPIHTILRLSKELGAERISKEAVQLLSDELMDKIRKIVQDAVKFANHAERKTIMKEDIKLAIEKNKL